MLGNAFDQGRTFVGVKQRTSFSEAHVPNSFEKTIRILRNRDLLIDHHTDDIVSARKKKHRAMVQRHLDNKSAEICNFLARLDFVGLSNIYVYTFFLCFFLFQSQIKFVLQVLYHTEDHSTFDALWVCLDVHTFHQNQFCTRTCFPSPEQTRVFRAK